MAEPNNLATPADPRRGVLQSPVPNGPLTGGTPLVTMPSSIGPVTMATGAGPVQSQSSVRGDLPVPPRTPAPQPIERPAAQDRAVERGDGRAAERPSVEPRAAAKRGADKSRKDKDWGLPSEQPSMNVTRIVLLLGIVGLVGASGYLAWQKMQPTAATAENAVKEKPVEPAGADKPVAGHEAAEKPPEAPEVAESEPPANGEPEELPTRVMPRAQAAETSPAGRLPSRLPSRLPTEVASAEPEGNPFDAAEQEEPPTHPTPRLPGSSGRPEHRIPTRNASLRNQANGLPSAEEGLEDAPPAEEGVAAAETAEWPTDPEEPPVMTEEPEAEIVERVPPRRGLPPMVGQAPVHADVEDYVEEPVTRVEYPGPRKTAAPGKAPAPGRAPVKRVAAPSLEEEPEATAEPTPAEAAVVDPDEATMNDGFEAVEVEKGRAVGTTEVRRPGGHKPERVAERPSSAGISLEAEIEEAPEPIAPRHTPTSAPKARTPVAIDEPAHETNADAGHRGDTYVVQPNDNFWKISRKMYGTARYFQALTRHNSTRAIDPHNLRPGMQVSTPSKETLQARYPELIDLNPAEATAVSRPVTSRRAAAARGEDPPTTSSEGQGLFNGPNGELMYRVGPDDTLGSISQKHLGRASRWNEIAELNREVLEDPNALRQGVELKLPNDASRVRVVND